MKTKIKITDSASHCVIDIEGIIGIAEEEQFASAAERVATYEKFRTMVEGIAQIDNPKVLVNIRSAGGDVNDALLIYEALASLDAQVTTCCYGYTASAATIIAQAASEGCRQIAASALYLIHRSSCAAEGNAEELGERMELLRKTDQRLATLYAQRSGRTAEEFEALMGENGGRGRWLSPDEAKEAGLVDCILGEASPQRNAVANLAERVAQWFGIKKPTTESHDTLPQDINILHLPVVDQALHSVILLDEGQQGIEPTTVQAVEDPSLGEVRRTQNQSAYEADARNCFGQ